MSLEQHILMSSDLCVYFFVYEQKQKVNYLALTIAIHPSTDLVRMSRK